MRQATITINGRLYDALSGTPIKSQPTQPTAANVVVVKPQQRTLNDISAPKPAQARPAQHPATTVHSKPQRSNTLNRQAIKKPQVSAQAKASAGVTAHHSVHQNSSRSPLISRFKPAIIGQLATDEAQQPETPPNTTPLHPSVIAAMQARAAKVEQVRPQSSKELKEMLIKERLAEVGNEAPVKKMGIFARKPKLASILVSSLSLLILGGYFTYMNLTNISMRVAASNAGINASFPGYKPDGYSLNGPITYSPGEVAISYKSNTNDSDFTLTQKSSNWDSQGVLDNFVRKQTSTYLTFQQRGVTVYTFNNKAAWTNGGLLYTIDGDASLSSEQILKLATSL